jgi:hypothetical protein
MRAALLTAALTLLAPSVIGQKWDICPMKIEVSKSGIYYTNRFHGRYRTSPKLLDDNLRAGCYNDNSPSKVTSVSVEIARGAPRRSIEELYRILALNGWPQARISVKE